MRVCVCVWMGICYMYVYELEFVSAVYFLMFLREIAIAIYAVAVVSWMPYVHMDCIVE